MAVHVPLAKDNIEQPHLHLMFSERAVDERTRELAEDRFFKRNGAKKDPAWNDRNKPEEVRERWVELMNGAMERAGIEQRVDARSWAKQGREDLAALREPKLLGGDEQEAIELREKVHDLRRQREELPAPHLDQVSAEEQIEREAQKAVAEIEKRRDQEIGFLDKLIEKARELAAEVKEKATECARNVAGRVEAFLAGDERGSGAEFAQKEASPLALSAEELMEQKLSALDRQMALQESMDARLAALDKRMEVEAKAQQEKERSQELERSQQRERSRGFGIER